MKISKVFAYVVLAVLISLTGCKSDEEKKAEKQAAINNVLESYNRQQAENQAKVEQEFVSVTDAQLRSLLKDCRSAIMSMAREKYKFEPFMVDEYSADVLQAQTYISKGKIQKADEIDSRVKEYRQVVKEAGGKHMPYRLSSRFSVMVTQDTFSGPERMNKNASCDWLPGFKAEAKWSY